MNRFHSSILFLALISMLKPIYWLPILFIFGLSSCSLITELGNMMCTLAPDTDHCYQFTAVQSGSPAACERIKGKKFKGSNPPRDKCYMQIAMNKWDYTICNNIKWWPMSYTPQECITGVGEKVLGESVAKDDIKSCKKLETFPQKTVYQDCISKLANPAKLKSGDEKIANLIEQLKGDSSNKTLQNELAKLKADKQTRYELMTDSERASYFSEKRQSIMADIDDDDVASAISKEFTKYRASEGNINNLLDKLAEVTKKQQMIKQADEDANYLTDQIKEQLEGIVGDKQDEIMEEMWEKAKEWIEKNGGEKLKWSLKEMEWAMGKYEKWSEMYESMKGKYDKLKGAYDEVMGVYNRVDEVNKMLAEGKIDAGKAKVLKGAVLLDKWLEYATGYVPVFGSTISTVSKATFWTVIEVAKKRAERSTALDKCFEDPANCDTDKISAY